MAGTFVLYGSCEFTTTNRRNQAANAVTNAASTRGLTPAAFDVFPAGVVNATINGKPGFTIGYSAPSIEVASACEAEANAALAAQNYEGTVSYQEV